MTVSIKIGLSVFCVMLLLSAHAKNINTNNQILKKSCENNELITSFDTVRIEFKFHYYAPTSKCFFWFKNRINWYENQKYCKNITLPNYNTATMVTIKNKAEMEYFIYGNIASKHLTDTRWFHSGAHIPVNIKNSSTPSKRYMFKWITDETSVDHQLWIGDDNYISTSLGCHPTTLNCDCVAVGHSQLVSGLVKTDCAEGHYTACQFTPKVQPRLKLSNKHNATASGANDMLLIMSDLWWMWLLVVVGICILITIAVTFAFVIRWKRRKTRTKTNRTNHAHKTTGITELTKDPDTEHKQPSVEPTSFYLFDPTMTGSSSSTSSKEPADTQSSHCQSHVPSTTEYEFGPLAQQTRMG